MVLEIYKSNCTKSSIKLISNNLDGFSIFVHRIFKAHGAEVDDWNFPSCSRHFDRGNSSPEPPLPRSLLTGWAWGNRKGELAERLRDLRPVLNSNSPRSKSAKKTVKERQVRGQFQFLLELSDEKSATFYLTQ